MDCFILAISLLNQIGLVQSILLYSTGLKKLFINCFNSLVCSNCSGADTKPWHQQKITQIIVNCSLPSWILMLKVKTTSLVKSSKVNTIVFGFLGIKLNAVSNKPNLTPWAVMIQWHQTVTYFLTSKTTSLVQSYKVIRSPILGGTI